MLRTLATWQATAKLTGEVRARSEAAGPEQSNALRELRTAESAERKALELHQEVTKQYRAQWARFGGVRPPDRKL